MFFLNWNQLHGHLVGVLETLKRGEVLVCSTDTVLGLLAQASQKGMQTVNTIKKRPDLKPPIILVGGIDAAHYFGDFGPDSMAQKLMSHWPAPLTIIVPIRPEIKQMLGIQENSIALRSPKHEGLQALLAHCKGLISTSANIHAKPVATTVADLDPELVSGIAGIITDDDSQNKVVPSTIVDCTTNELRIIRRGAFVLD